MRRPRVGNSSAVTSSVGRSSAVGFRFATVLTPHLPGTIMVLGGDEILLGSSSSLGPIDAPIAQDGKQYSADALLGPVVTGHRWCRDPS